VARIQAAGLALMIRVVGRVEVAVALEEIQAGKKAENSRIALKVAPL
jgi:hypothetical protein